MLRKFRSLASMLVLLALVVGCSLNGCTADQQTQTHNTVVKVQNARARMSATITALETQAALLPADDPARGVIEKNLPELKANLARLDLYLGLIAAVTEPVPAGDPPTTQPATLPAGGP